MPSSPEPDFKTNRGEDKDSLFSTESAEDRTDVAQTVQEEEEEEYFEYKEEDLSTLVTNIKTITTLYDLRPTDWNEQCEETIRSWLQHKQYPLLTIFFDGKKLTADLGMPQVRIVDFMYFLREPGQMFDVKTFFDSINFGLNDDDVDGTILNIVENVYIPVFLNSTRWPDSVRNYLYHSIHMFMSKMVDVHHRMFGLTVLYIPSEVHSIPVEVAAQDKELIKRLEAVVVYWTKQVRIGIQEQEQSGSSEEMLTILDEYEFWKFRYENLLGLQYQLENNHLKHICDILVLVQSTYIRQFMILIDEIKSSIDESKSNIDYLNVLIKSVTRLKERTKPTDIPSNLEEILQLIRYIWLNSPYYNTAERITLLCKSLSNQIIIQCTNYLDLGVIFDQKQTRKATKMLEECIECMSSYIRAYVLVSESHIQFGDYPWDLHKAPIFNHIDSYMQRCRDLIEICDAMIVFGRFDETENIPFPQFIGSKGREFDSWVERIEKMFNDVIVEVMRVRHRILDVQAVEWYEDILKFRTKTKDIEVVVENLTNAVFEEVANVEDGILCLGCLYNYSKKKSLQLLFEQKTTQVYKMFYKEIQDCKDEIAQDKVQYISLMPYYSGKAMMIQMQKRRLNILKKKFDEAGWMMPCSISKEIFGHYEKLMYSMQEKILFLYRKWVSSTGEDVSMRLNRALMCRSPTRPGLLECNIDRSLLKIFREAKYFNESLEFEIPFHVKPVYQKSETIRFVYESVLTVVLDYNRVISSLSDEERLLFKPLINAVERKIAPGLSKLTWAADVVDEYIAECCNTTAELQDFVDDYKNCNLKIVAICEKICDTLLINVTPNYNFELDEFVNHLSKYMEEQLACIISYYQEIIQFIIVVFEGFEYYIQQMSDQWIKYINNFDKLFEEALRMCCKNSMQNIYEILHGDEHLGPTPVLKEYVNLQQNKISFKPSIGELSHAISHVHYSIVQGLKKIPRLNDKFHVALVETPPFSVVIDKDADCSELQQKLNEEVIINITKIKEYLQLWEPFKNLWEVDKEKFIKRYASQMPTAILFDSNLQRYIEVANSVQIQDSVVSVHFLLINCDELKKSIIEHIEEWQFRNAQLLIQLTLQNINDLIQYIVVNIVDVMKHPSNLTEMQDALKLYDKLRTEIPEKEEIFPTIKDKIAVLDKYYISFSDEIRNGPARISTMWAEYLTVLDLAEKMLNYSKDKFKAELLEQTEQLRQEGVNMLQDFLKTGPFSSDWSPKQALAHISNLREQLNRLKEKEAELRANLAIFGLSLPESEELKQLEKELLMLELVWQLADEWDMAWEKYKSGEFWTIETAEMEETAQTLFRKLTKLSQQLKDKGWSIVEDTRLKVDAFRRTLPLLGDLKNPAMRSRHWDKVRATVGIDFDEKSKEFNLDAIYQMQMHKFAEDINDISNSASMELQIEKGLRAISDAWRAMLLEMAPHKDMGIYRIKTVDEIFQTLEENMLQISAMKGTRFVQPFIKEVDYWEKTLSYILETLEIALTVQRMWLYLEIIFFGEDIRKQLPKETEDFTRLTEDWRTITAYMFYAKKVLKATHFKPPPYLFNKLNQMNAKLDAIQRELEKYLETKRHIFPRFYFISNDDMLEILGNSKKPEMVQQHLKKLFDNLYKLKVEKNIGSNKIEAIGMYSDDGEYVEFAKAVIIQSSVEQWLLEVETAMRLILKQEFKPIRGQLKKMLNKRDKWLIPNIGQLCNASSLIQWTTDCTRAIVHSNIMESKKPLKRLRKKQNQVLSKLSELSRQNLTKIQRLKANALITIEIHSRDVIDRLYKANVRDVNAFEWFSQLRFYWDRDTDICIVRQTNTMFKYGYEYNGNSGRLVITPLTDRCYITLTTALHLFRGGSPKGPAGTGKTETVKDLGKAMGMWVIVNNCSEGLDYKSMGKCFSGLAQTGAWGCFDEFNRINIEVLSVVAQQILSILSAISQKKTKFVFEGSEISLKSTCGIFITMNPGYAGRTELPDNLKSMFRPISMMIPDSAIIAENILFSDGFQNTKMLAKKVYTLYQLAIQQLSKQDHYDFGLRSMVALLRYAGRKRRVLFHLAEDQVVYLAMRDMNIARLTADDVPLFNGIMSDIFPSVTLPMIDYIEMTNAITEYMAETNLQPIPAAIVKVIQLYETKTSRHSVMILGKTGTAKSTTWRTLKNAMKKLCALNKPGFNKVHEYPINPKALNLGELYGEYNLSTNEWLDGVISAIMRQTCQDEAPDEKWILFDGPVDAVWIENMNSVMDDNKVLTLINSDRITMPEQVSLLFEVEDLAVASPATVSRCGMVYHDYKDWGWQPYATSWLKSQTDKGPNFQSTIKEFFDFYLGPLLEYKRLHCEETIACPEINVVMSFCKLLNIYGQKKYGLNPADEERYYEIAKSWFLFCLIWSVCATTNEDGRRKLDNYIREKEGIFPIKDTVYEYFVDQYNGGFSHWESKLPRGWKYEPGCPFYKILVPTVDTLRYEFLINALLLDGKPVLLVGSVGTGKSSSAHAILNAFSPSKYSILNINMSAQTSSINLQDAIEARVEKRTKGVFVPVGSKDMITFLDDLNMPAKETYGSQPPLELLRQWIDYGFWYDRLKQTRTYILRMYILAAMGPPGGGRNNITERLLSRFNVLNMTFPDDATIVRIFGKMLNQHLSDFGEEIKIVGKHMTDTTVDLYNNVTMKMLPTPTKIHYLFNLRDISKIFQGLLRSHKDYQNTKPMILRLWIHECFRVFFDRLTDDKDREWFFEQMNEQLGSHFELTLHSLCTQREVPIFADFVNPYNVYEDLLDIPALRKYLFVQLEEYNSSPGVVRLDLVLFKDAILHITRIIRVISQPRGHMLLVGIGGSGRQSLARISAYICEYLTYQIILKKQYRVAEFKEDLKKLYKLSGTQNKPTSFLFNDTQITDESFLEIVNNMLNTGEVANLYKPEEFEEVKGELESAATKAGVISSNTEQMYNFLVERVLANLHIVLCMSPIGEKFRNRLRQYPAIINCTTIDWFNEWPIEALLEVANKYIADVNFVETITGEQLERRRGSVLVSSQDKLRESCASTFAYIHASVIEYSNKMAQEMKRHNYVTPTNYLELVMGYKRMLAEKRLEIATDANKLRSGLWKIDDCKEKVKTMSVELEEAQVKVAEFQQQCDEYLVIIVAQKKEADEQQKEVTKKSIRIGEEEVECQRMADLAQADLDEAMPALNEAVAALDALSKKDISEMKSYSQPPQKVRMVMEAVCILKGVEPTWESAKKLLGELDFLKALKEFDRNHITEKTLKKIAGYTMNEEFVPDKVGIVSFAAKSLCMWVIAIEKYARVWKIVGPKQARLEEAQESLKEKQRLLQEAQQKLAEINAMLAKLEKEYEEKLLQKEELNKKAELLRLKMERAAMLVECLSGERERWTESVQILDSVFDHLPGDCLLATAFISYLGPFVTNYREELIDKWITEIRNQEIPFTPNFNVINFLTDPTSIREWNIEGLPQDSFSTENGIIITRCSRWPLVIDPQIQAAKWIKSMEAKNKLQVVDFELADFLKVVVNSIMNGTPVLIQNISEGIDPSIEPVLSKEIVRQGGQDLIYIDDNYVSYNPKFRFFMTTKLTNPHYPPEISTKTTLVNFAVKEVGLQNQLLGIVVRKERPILEEQHDEMVLTIAKGKRTLIDLENELLRLLNETRGEILEDVELFENLQTSKATAAAVKISLETSEKTEIEIETARMGYEASAKRAAILYFVLYDLGRIDPMYQFSLDSYILLFDISLMKSKKNPVLSERINSLNEYHTYAVYKNTCRALFEQHKLLFSFHMCIKILEAQGKVVMYEYQFLLKGGVVLDRENQIDKPCAWLNEEGWDNITELDKLQGFHGIIDTFEQYPRDWYVWYTNTEPETLPLIAEWNEVCNEFQKMLIIRSLRQDRVSCCIANFVVNQLGPQFTEPPILDIKAVVEESIAQSPLIFVLSPGVDPTNSLIQLAATCHMTSKFHSCSLGQGQAPVATKLLQSGAKEGHWVFLANCHLSLSWMPKLDKIVDTLQVGRVHKNFRLWLSSSPHPDFPISILQTSLKMTTEPPKGVKANLRRLYQLITEDQFNICQVKEKYKKLLFCLCFFHSILLERKKFQQLGWNVVYSFNDSDFEVSENLLTIYLDEYENTPWDALKYLIAGVNYGGHVTDDWDRRLLLTYINQYFSEDSLVVPYHRLSSLTTYYIPKDGSIQSYQDYITLLPNVDRPESFGQHPNADITSLISESRMLFETLMSLQIQTSSGETDSKEQRVAELAADVLGKIPSTIDYERTDKLIGPLKAPLDVVLLQEIQRYNILLVSIQTSLDQLGKAIQGFIVMSSKLEDIYNCIYEARVPQVWLKAYPSLKLLGSWTRDLIARVDHFSQWASTVHPPLFFWLSAYTFPTGYLTAVLQTTARAAEIPIDSLSWEFDVLTVDENTIQTAPLTGVYVRGLYLEGGGWDKKAACLIEPQPMQLVSTMPLINFKPMEVLKKKTRGLYSCPCYYFPIRAGAANRSGFVVAVDLKSGEEKGDFWTKRGTALLLSLAN